MPQNDSIEEIFTEYSPRLLGYIRSQVECREDAEDTVCEDIAQTLFCAPQDAPDIICLRHLIWQELDAALSQLPPEQGEVFCLTVFFMWALICATAPFVRSQNATHVTTFRSQGA